MRVYIAAGLILSMAVLGTTADAAPYDFTRDYYEQGGYSIGDGSAPIFETWEVGSRITQGRLEFSILTNLPPTGAYADDSYVDNTLISPGDLWITVGTRDPFDGGYPRHAIALTNRNDQDHPDDYDTNFGGNVVRQKYPGEVWPAVTQGRLYKDAEFSTGTFETYQQWMNSNGYWYTPDDRDGDDTTNSYMSLIKDFREEVTGHSDAAWTFEPYWYWDDGLGDWALQDSWRITGYVDLDEIGLTPLTPYSLFVAPECGNDGAGHSSPVPEPAAFLPALLGLIAARRRRK